MGKTKIEWADRVWNPVTGCTKVSDGCKNCYAECMAQRFWRNGVNGDNYRPFTEVRCHPERLEQPLHWKKPAHIFVDSMSDLFHKDVPSLFIDHVFETMHLAYRHTFMILTKRAERMNRYISQRYLPNQRAILPNVWLGVSVENQATADERIPILLQTPAAVRFVSVEPMLGPVSLAGLDDDIYRPWLDIHAWKAAIDWVICGCESGPYKRPMDLDWTRSLRDHCQRAG